MLRNYVYFLVHISKICKIWHSFFINWHPLPNGLKKQPGKSGHYSPPGKIRRSQKVHTRTLALNRATKTDLFFDNFFKQLRLYVK